ncbi:hypothetical protein UFOVP580_42 [uncultured Caudovirales phage]|uniref:Uncharacterized protein n=1 Tax=uncultured Caudovirales phage TaxID=2100421 RepID=A0A6J5PC62_9CAUD|nr:hypothetical protein UFOVP580_42 [uncultured Caudovirales phage]
MSVTDFLVGFLSGSYATTIAIAVIISHQKSRKYTTIPAASDIGAAPRGRVEPSRGTTAPPTTGPRYGHSVIMREALREAQVADKIRTTEIIPSFVKAQLQRVIEAETRSPELNFQRWVEIVSCKDPSMWYAGHVGSMFKYHSIWPESGWAVRDGQGFSNVVKYEDGQLELRPLLPPAEVAE